VRRARARAAAAGERTTLGVPPPGDLRT
jgi:hypothetical protein